MSKIVKTIIIIILLFIIVGLAWWWYMTAPAGERSNESSNVDINSPAENQASVSAIFENKVVYDMGADISEEILREDCSERGGEFNTCGSPCAPDSDACVQVCAYTCENLGESDIPESWKTYFGNGLGFEMKVPSDMEIDHFEDEVRFQFRGPTQEAGTELYDGISIVVNKISIKEGQTIKNAAEEMFQEDEKLGEINIGLHAVNFAGSEGYAHTSTTLGQNNKIIIPSGGEALVISYMAPDPTGQGFSKTTSKILSTFKLIE